MADLRTLTGTWDELLDEHGDAAPGRRRARRAPPRASAWPSCRPARTPPTSTSSPWASRSPCTPTASGIDRAWPFDVIPRVIDAARVARRRGRAHPAARGPEPLHRRPLQRAAGHRRRRVPGRAARRQSANYRPECRGVHPAVRRVGPHQRQRPRPRRRRHDVRARGQPPGAVRASATSSRTGSSPSEPSPTCSSARASCPVDGYTDELAQAARVARPRRTARDRPSLVVLTPGHLQLGLLRALVPRPADGRRSWSRAATCSSATTTASTCARSTGPQRVDVIYRRIDDLFLDPEAFRPDSTLGVPGLMRAWRAGNVGHRQRARRRRGRRQGRLRLGARHHPLLPRRGAAHPQRADLPLPVPEDERRFVIDNIGDLVVKPANESGGYGLLIGNRATRGRARRRGSRPSRPIPATGWPSRSSTCRRRRRCATAARAPPPRPAAVHPHRSHQLRHRRRPDARRAARRARSS